MTKWREVCYTDGVNNLQNAKKGMVKSMKHIPYDCIAVSEFSEGLAAIFTAEGVGFINTAGELVIPPVFEHIQSPPMINRYMFKEGLSAFAKDGKCGYIDKQGNTVIAPEYELVLPFSQGIAAVSIEGKWGAIDQNGKMVIPMEYRFVQTMREGLCGVYKDPFCGYLDQSGKTVIPLTDKYDLIHLFGDGMAVVTVGNWKLDLPKQNENESNDDFLKRVGKKVDENFQKNSFGAINQKGELIIEPKYQFLSDFGDGLAPASIDGKKMYINTLGETVFEVPQYDQIGSFFEGLAWVQSGKKYGCIDTSGKLIIPTEYDNMPIFANKYAPVSKNGKWGLIDQSGAVRLPLEYDFVSSVENGYAVVRKDASWSIVNLT